MDSAPPPHVDALLSGTRVWKITTHDGETVCAETASSEDVGSTHGAESCQKRSPLSLSLSTLCLSSPSPFSLACARVLSPRLGVWEIYLGHLVCTIVDSALDDLSVSSGMMSSQLSTIYPPAPGQGQKIQAH